MGYRALAARRRIAGLIGTCVICTVIALAVDGMIAGGRKDPRAFDLLPGQALQLSDTMPRGAQGLSELALASASPQIVPRLTETYSGFWLGGTLWRAELELPADIAPGEYAVELTYQNATAVVPPQRFRIRVRKDAAAMQAASLSPTVRATGISPYVLAAMLLPLALIPMGASALISRRIAQALAAQRMAEIYRSMSTPEGQRIFFTLPDARLALGAVVEALGERTAQPIGRGRIVGLRGADVEAIMDDGIYVRPGALARLAEDSSISVN
jgi:hypothetical protein